MTLRPSSPQRCVRCRPWLAKRAGVRGACQFMRFHFRLARVCPEASKRWCLTVDAVFQEHGWMDRTHNAPRNDEGIRWQQNCFSCGAAPSLNRLIVCQAEYLVHFRAALSRARTYIAICPIAHEHARNPPHPAGKSLAQLCVSTTFEDDVIQWVRIILDSSQLKAIKPLRLQLSVLPFNLNTEMRIVDLIADERYKEALDEALANVQLLYHQNGLARISQYLEGPSRHILPAHRPVVCMYKGSRGARKTDGPAAGLPRAPPKRSTSGRSQGAVAVPSHRAAPSLYRF